MNKSPKKSVKIALVGGARPNFMKIAPLYHEFKQAGLPFFVVSTGQHFDQAMAQQFFTEFKFKPHYTLEPRRDSVVVQMADIMSGLEEIFKRERPWIVVVVGDVNSTLAASIVANKMQIPLAHVEAGLRSGNDLMPEETNRILTDHLSDLLFVTTEEGRENLELEGIKDGVHSVGNIMIDTLALFLPKIKKLKKFNKHDENFFFCTLHRAENVDHKEIFTAILDALELIAKDAPIYLPLHPRTAKMAKQFGLEARLRKIFKILPPLSYQDTIYYQKNAKLVLTDSGGIQEESSFLGVPCLTLRTETERPITVTKGTNKVAGISKKSILQAYVSHPRKRKKTKIPLWDGKTANRIVEVLSRRLNLL